VTVIALRALLCAVLGGFIGAAPAAPVAAPGDGEKGYVHAGSQSQKRETSCEVTEPTPRGCAAAPPCAGGQPAAVVFAHWGAPEPFALALVAMAPRPGRAHAPSIEDIRAGFLDLPPPAL
jgi:hypothetical protein